MTFKQAIGPAVSAFAGAAAGALSALPSSDFLSLASAERALLGAALAGVIAVAHLYQPKPGAPS